MVSKRAHLRSCEVNKGVTYLSSIGWFCGDCLREFLPATVGDWMFLLGEHFPTKKLYEVKREAKILKRKSPNIILGSFQKYTGEDIIVMLKGE